MVKKGRDVILFVFAILGFLSATAQAQTILHVNRTDPACGGQSPCFSTIQAAIDAAGPGNIVRIQAGTYAEQLTIQKNDFTGAAEADRIVIESEPALAQEQVVVQGRGGASCTNNYAIRIRRSKFVTIRGLTITGAGAQAITLMGSNNGNHSIHIELNRIFGNSVGNNCNGGIEINAGNPGTLVVNNLIYGNGRNGITILDSGGPQYIVNNTIYTNQWNGVNVSAGQQVLLANNIINANGVASGNQGTRFGIHRETVSPPAPQTLQLRNNLACGNTGGQISGPVLDGSDSGNFTPLGNEGTGVSALPGCDNPANLFTNVNGPDNLPNTIDDDFSLKQGSLAIDVGMDPRTIGLDPVFNPIFEADFRHDGMRPADGNVDRVPAFDASAFEFPNAPPLANAGANLTVYRGQLVTLNGSLSSDPEGAPLGFLWTIVSQPTASNITINGTNTATPTFTPLVLGEYTFQLVVNDGQFNSAPATVRVTAVNRGPTANAGGPYTGVVGIPVQFSGSGTDPDGDPVTFSWNFGDGGSESGPTPAHTYAAIGTYTITLTVMDSVGASAVSQSTATIEGVSISNVDPASGPIGTLITLTGTNFEPGTTQVTFNGVAAAIRTITATKVTTTVPPSATTGPLTVTTSRGSASRNFAVPASQDFTLVISPSNLPTGQGGSAGVLIEALPVNGFSGLIALTTGPLPAGVTATFSPANLAPNNHSLLTLSTTLTTRSGAHAVEIRGTSPIDGQTITRTGTVTLNLAAPEQTILVGQVLDGDDRPIPNVSIKLGGATLPHLGSSDAAGNLFIPLSVSGPTVFLIDGSPANTATTNYPTIPITLNIQPEVINELGYLPRLRGQAVARLIPFVPGEATVITDPDLPGFKMTIPAGVQIIGWDGQPNNQFSVTTVPVDRSPLPPLVLPPGFEARQTYLFSFGKVGGGVPTGNIAIDTPNDVGGLPGDKVDLYYFNEAPDGTAPNQWEKYGIGTVSADGTTIVTDINPATGLPYGIPRFCCGARTNVIQRFLDFVFGGPSGGPRDGGKKAGDPVDVSTGFFYVDKTDMVLPGRLPIVVTRTYRTNQTNQGPFGIGTSWSFDVALASPPNGSTDALILVSPGNRQDVFSRQSFDTFVNSTSPWLRGAVLGLNPLTLTFKDGGAWRFDQAGRLVSQTDRNGNLMQLSRDGQGRIVTIGLFIGGQLTIDYSNAGIASITDPIGRQVRYTYDAAGRLQTVIDPAGGVTRYTYDSAHRMLTLTDPRGITFLANEYDANGRVVRQTQADGGVWIFAYTSSGTYVSEAVVTNPRGHATTYRFNSAGYQTSETDALGQTTTIEREAVTNLVLSVTDPLKRVTRVQYDGAGNATRITDPANNVRTLIYEPTFNKVTRITDPLGNVTRFEYSNAGNLSAAIDPLGNRTTVAYNSFGQPLSTTDPLSNITTFAYDGFGRLTDVTDPLGNRSRRSYDPAFRLISQTDPRGKVTTFAYDNLNRITRITDPASGVTRFDYDANGNLRAVTDARGSVTAFTYDSMDQLATRTDPVGAVEQFEYDPIGNLRRHIDRKGQLNRFTYDSFGRRIRGDYADGSTTDFVYDAVGRLVHAIDSAGGMIGNQYDILDRLVAQITDLGTVTYRYDSVGRRTRMDAPGQSPVTYDYDRASRLRQVLQGSQVVDIQYDALGRRILLTLPNAVSTEYQYDAASRLAALIYRNALGVLGDLTYQYDRAGNRTGVSGTFARALLSDPIDSATYDAANRQLQFGDKTMAFDANGNVTSITDSAGTATLAWDARNRLVGLTWPASVTFGYDHTGRRIAKTLDGVRSAYLYDGLDIIQEVASDTTVAYLRSLTIDEPLVRNGTEFYLRDGVGSTNGLTDAAGLLTSRYRYASFGETAPEGASSQNPFQYTSRENDGTGLYFYRARYHHPALGRFISEDPLWFRDGINPYTYVHNNPITRGDPLGLLTVIVHGLQFNGEPDPAYSKQLGMAIGATGEGVEEVFWNGNPLSGEGASAAFDQIAILASKAAATGEPFNIIGHSWGSVLAANYVAATGQPVDLLVTMGSPLSAWAADPRAADVWVNIWSAVDNISWGSVTTGAEQVHVVAGLTPIGAHTGYWTNRRTINEIVKRIRSQKKGRK